MSKRTKARRAHYSAYKSTAQEIFGSKDMIISRPEGMEYDEFRILQRIQNKVLRLLFPKPAPRHPSIPLRLGYNLHPKIKPQDIDEKS